MLADNLITIQEASKITGVSESTIYFMCVQGRIPARKLGRQFVIRASWAESEREKRTPPEGYITVKEATKIAGVTRQRMHQIIKAGLVRSVSRLIFEKPLVWVDSVSLEEWMRETRGE